MSYVPSVTELLQRYRRDRHELLSFLLTSSALKKVILPPGAVSTDDLDLHQVSVDHVLQCCRRGVALDLGEAIKLYLEESTTPPAGSNGLSDIFYLVTDPNQSGSPPNRKPPSLNSQIPTVSWKSLSSSQPSQPSQAYFSAQSDHSRQSEESQEEDLETLVNDDEVLEVEIPEEEIPHPSQKATDESSFPLPSFVTGLTDDDLKICAFELLLASVGTSGGLQLPIKEKVKEKVKEASMRKVMMGRFVRKEHKTKATPVLGPPDNTVLLELIRFQLEIPEAIDTLTREALLQVISLQNGQNKKFMVVPLELLCTVSSSHFSDKKSYMRWAKRQLNLLQEGLLFHPHVRLDGATRLVADMKALVSQFESSESLNHQKDILKGLRDVVTYLASRPSRGENSGESCHWVDGYHLNVSLYKHLLQACLDSNKDGELLEEVDSIQEMLKSTRRSLGITQTMHSVVYSGVLFQQFMATGADSPLQEALVQLRNIPFEGQRSSEEQTHLNSLCTLVQTSEGPRSLSLLHTFLTPIKLWIDQQLKDYHRYFPQGGSGRMESLLPTAMTVWQLLLSEDERNEQGLKSVDEKGPAQICEEYIRSSLSTAFRQLAELGERRPEANDKHPLALLANDVGSLIRKEVDSFSPILKHWNRLSVAIAASHLHRLFGSQLKPFLAEVNVLTDDARQVLPSADRLETYLLNLMTDLQDEEGEAVALLRSRIEPYEVTEATGNMAMRWVNTQVGMIQEWTERSITAEKWEPASQTKRYGHSVVDVFRIIEETLEHFFDLGIPLRINLLRALTNGIDNCAQLYINRVLTLLGSKDDLMPPLAPLTRFKKDIPQKQATLSSRRTRDQRLLDETRIADLNQMTTSSLCVRLNSLHFVLEQLDSVEESVRGHFQGKRAVEEKTQRSRHKGDELAGMFEQSRRVANTSIEKICDFTGTKVVFWDMREVFLEGLYKASVASARMDEVLSHLDSVLRDICDVIAEHLRDKLILSLLQSCLDGLDRVLLDGGPSRAFAQSDAEMLEDDVHDLKAFFIAGGDGLPRGVVESAAAPVQQILNLYSLDTPIVVDNFKRSSDILGSGKTAGTSKVRSATDANTLLRVLCHRADREASKFLKKQFKLPKTVT